MAVSEDMSLALVDRLTTGVLIILSAGVRPQLTFLFIVSQECSVY